MASNFTEADVINALAGAVATLIAGGIGALAVWLIAKRSKGLLKEQFQLNKEQHREQLELDKTQHREQLEMSKKQQQVQGLLEAFRLLDSRNHRNSRKVVYQLYHAYLITKDVKPFRDIILTWKTLGETLTFLAN